MSLIHIEFSLKDIAELLTKEREKAFYLMETIVEKHKKVNDFDGKGWMWDNLLNELKEKLR